MGDDHPHMSVGYHFEFIAYICEGGCIRQSPFDGWVTFTTIFQQWPADTCRFAVARRVPLIMAEKWLLDPSKGLFSYSEPIGPYLAWDFLSEPMTEVAKAARYGLISAPEPTVTGDTEDGLVMRLAMLYDKIGGRGGQ